MRVATFNFFLRDGGCRSVSPRTAAEEMSDYFVTYPRRLGTHRLARHRGPVQDPAVTPATTQDPKPITQNQ